MLVTNHSVVKTAFRSHAIEHSAYRHIAVGPASDRQTVSTIINLDLPTAVDRSRNSSRKAGAMDVFVPTESLPVPPRSGKAVRVRAGTLIAVIDVEGSQVGDVFAIADDDHDEYLSAAHNRQWYRLLFPRLGEPFVTNRLRPILTMVEDTSPGLHDMLFAACAPATYRVKFGVQGWHPSCEENFHLALKELGAEFGRIPDPVNVFQNSPVTDATSGQLELRAAKSSAGNRVVFRAEMNIIFVLTACSSDIAPTNGGKCKSLLLEIAT